MESSNRGQIIPHKKFAQAWDQDWKYNELVFGMCITFAYQQSQ